MCTRPRLTSHLIALGYEFKTEPHPFQQGKTAWMFPLTEQLAGIVADYYTNLGKKPPKAILDALEGVNDDE